MKTCQVCSAVALDDAPHCAACGEASWTFATAIEAAPEESPDAPVDATASADAPTPTAPRRNKRGPTQ